MKLDLTFFKTLLSTPSAPFKEELVTKVITDYLNKNQVPFFKDSTGNLVLGVENAEAYLDKIAKNTIEPLRIFISHLDHPGFHGIKWKKKGLLEVKWFGGSPSRFIKNSRVWLADSNGYIGDGKFDSVILNKSKTAIDKGFVKTNLNIENASSLFGGFGFKKPLWNIGKVYYTKAADDLVGCFISIQIAIEEHKKDPSHYIGLLTRAEEVGFIGAIAHFEEAFFLKANRPLLFISLETSRTLPGAVIGEGPILRLGDRATVFDPDSFQVMLKMAKQKLKKYQKRIMDGGTCEGTVATAYGYPTLGISIPLGNYHNQSLEGGPEARGKWGPAPEFVHWKDIEGMHALCQTLLESGTSWDDPWKDKRKEFKLSLDNYRRFL